MNMWISVPSIYIPQEANEQVDVTIDPLYKNILLAYESATEIKQENLLLPRASNMECEDLASNAIRPWIREYSKDKLPGILSDCRSSTIVGGPAPTYKLGAKTGLYNILPFSLDGQAGTEALQALIFIKHMEQIKNNEAIISTVQKIVPPDTRIKEKYYPLADAAASILVSVFEAKYTKSFKILGIELIQSQSAVKWDLKLDSILKGVTNKAGLAIDSIQWSIAHKYSASFEENINKLIPDCFHLTRDIYPEFNFGCSDPLISLNRLAEIIPQKTSGTGILWFAGRFGSVGAVLLELN